MVTERFYVIFCPFGQVFRNRNLWWYCFLFCIATLIFWLIPVFSECPINFDYYTLQYVPETECQHFLTLLFDDFHWTIPTTCMIFNIGLILRLSYRRRNNTTRSASFRSRETLMMVQAVAFTIFLLSFEITKLATFLISEFFTPISIGAHRIIYYSQKTAITLLILLLIPFYSGCAVNYSFYTFDYSTECDPDGHFITYIFDTYTGLIPLGCLVLNFALIFYISQRRKRIDNTGNGKLNARQSHEKTLLIQSISSTTFLLIYEITEKATDIFSDEYDALPGFTRRMIYYARAGSVAFTCFFIYFVGTPSIRKIIITKVMRLMRRERKQPSRMLTTWNSRDVSTMF
ncbi:unnamed protein product [Caenorhabditis brenneri]